MDELIHRIEEKLSVKGKRLSAVSNPDGFLKRSDTQQMVLENCGLLLLPVTSSLELRIRYELYDKESFDRVCYIIDDLSMILPDMEQLMHMVPVFSISELFPACNSSELLRAKLSFAGASYIFNKRFVFNLSAEETKRVMDNAQILYGQTADEYINQLNIISLT